MPTPLMKSFATKSGKSIDAVEKIWNSIKSSMGDDVDFAKLTGAVKKALKIESMGMQSFKCYIEGKFNIKKALKSGNINKDHVDLIGKLEKLGWVIIDSLDFVITGKGFELKLTNKKTKDTRNFKSNDKKPITDVLQQALTSLK